MDKLYTINRWVDRSSRFHNIETTQLPLSPIFVTEMGGHRVRYDYYATAQSHSNHLYKRLSRIIVGWLLYITTLGYLGRQQTVAAWMAGRRVDRIYLIHNDTPPPSKPPQQKEPSTFQHLDKQPMIETVSRSASQQKSEGDPTLFTGLPPIDPSIWKLPSVIPQSQASSERKCSDILTKGPLRELLTEKDSVLGTRWNGLYAIGILRFAEPGQMVLPILEEYYRESEPNKTEERLTRCCIKVLEQASGLQFGKNDLDDERIVLAFLEKVLRRQFHGTSKASAKTLLQKSISFDPSAHGIDYAEFQKLLDECKLSLGTYYERHRESKEEDSSAFYVTGNASTAEFYARNNGPEFFNRFRECGSRLDGTFDREQFKRKIIQLSPQCTDVERVATFAENHWARCAPHNKNGTVLLIELSEADTKKRLQEKLPPPYCFLDSLPIILKGYYFYLTRTFGYSFRTYPKPVIGDPKEEKIQKVVSILTLALWLANGNLDERLDSSNTTIPPSVIQAIKVPIL